MKVNNVDFHPDWVARFKTAEAFADSPANGHLYPELKTVEARKEQLKAVWKLIVKPIEPISDGKDSGANANQFKKAKHKPRHTEHTGGVGAADGGPEPIADGEGLGQSEQTNHLPGEVAVQSEDSGEKG